MRRSLIPSPQHLLKSAATDDGDNDPDYCGDDDEAAQMVKEIQFVGFKDPIKAHEKAREMSERFTDGQIAESCIADVNHAKLPLRTGTQIGFLGPLSASRDGAGGRRAMRMLRRLRGWSVGLALSGGVVGLLTLSPPAFAAAFGPNAIIASNLLAFTLLAHVPFFAALTLVCLTHMPLHMLHPTDASRASRRLTGRPPERRFHCGRVV